MRGLWKDAYGTTVAVEDVEGACACAWLRAFLDLWERRVSRVFSKSAVESAVERRGEKPAAQDP